MIQAYAQAQFRVFPLQGKIPLIKEWQNVPYDPAPAIQGNFGVVTGKEILVIDVDVKNGAQGLASYEKLRNDTGLPEGWEEDTFCVQTGTGGFHVYLRKPADINIRKNLKEYPGIDFLSGNAFVVGAGSIHPDTRCPYTVLFGRSPNEVCPAPATILDILSKPIIIEENAKEAIVDDDPVNVARFVEHLAQMPVISQGGRDNQAYTCAIRGHDFGLSEEMCYTTMLNDYNDIKNNPPIEAEHLRITVRNAYKYAKNKAGNRNVRDIFSATTTGNAPKADTFAYDTDKNNKIIKTFRNAVNHIRVTDAICDTFRFNTFSQQIEINSKAPWYAKRGHNGPTVDERDIKLLRYALINTVNVDYGYQHVEDAVVIVSADRHYHPVKNYLNTLEWDGVKRLETWLIDFAKIEDNEYTRAVSKKVLCAAVKRIYEPGCKFDQIFLIEGAQGAKKSTLCTVLGRLWYGDMNLDPHHKDAIHNLFGKWIIELSEMTPLVSRHADAAALKAFMSRATDTARLSFEKTSRDYPRQSIFIGTLNPEHMGYLNDPTGARRFWIVKTPCTETNQIDILGLENVCDQLWAEAKMCYKHEPLYLTGKAQEIQLSVTQARMPEEPYRDAIIKWSDENPTIDEVKTINILEYMGIASKHITRLDQARVGNSFAALGWDKIEKRERGVHEIYYGRPLKERVVRDAK